MITSTTMTSNTVLGTEKKGNLAQHLKYCLGYFRPISECLGWNLGYASDSSFLLMQILEDNDDGSRSFTPANHTHGLS